MPFDRRVSVAALGLALVAIAVDAAWPDERTNRQDDEQLTHSLLIEEFKGLEWTPLQGATSAAFALVGHDEERVVFRIPAATRPPGAFVDCIPNAFLMRGTLVIDSRARVAGPAILAVPRPGEVVPAHGGQPRVPGREGGWLACEGTVDCLIFAADCFDSAAKVPGDTSLSEEEDPWLRGTELDGSTWWTGGGGIEWAARANSIEGMFVSPGQGFAMARVLPGRNATVDYYAGVVHGLVLSGELDLVGRQEMPRRLAADAYFELEEPAAGNLSLACRSSEPCLLLLPPNYEMDSWIRPSNGRE